jgi:hypothetical protein
MSFAYWLSGARIEMDVETTNQRTGDQFQGCEMSVILVTPDRYDTIRGTVQALRRQSVRQKLELVVVGPSKSNPGLIESDFEGFWGCQVLELGDMTLASAQAAGVRAAQAPIIAFTEDHCFPAEQWAEALIKRHEESWAGVGPAMKNANPESAVSWANFIMKYGRWIQPLPKRPSGIMPGHNSSYKRDLLLQYASELDSWLENETTMQWDLIARGHVFYVEPQAVAHHLNYSRFWISARNRVNSGRVFAARRSHGWSRFRRAAYLLGLSLIPLKGLIEIMPRARDLVGLSGSIRLVPCFFMLLLSHCLGEMIGCLAGAGPGPRKATANEFHRERFLNERDRRLARNVEQLIDGFQSH